MEICDNCYQQIDLETCHCGDPMTAHGLGSGHIAIPIGCMCGYAKFKPLPEHLKSYILSITPSQENELEKFLIENSVTFDAQMVCNVIKMAPKFEQTGTVYRCLACGQISEIIIQNSGTSSCGAVEPASHWADGKIVCPDCGATESWTDSS